MTVTAEQLARYREAFQSLAVIGPAWVLPPIPEWRKSNGDMPAKRDGRALMLTYGSLTLSIHGWASRKKIDFTTLYSRYRSHVRDPIEWPLSRVLNQAVKVKKVTW